MIRVIDDVFGTKIAGAEVQGSRVAIRMLREPVTRADWTTHDYNVHFSFGIENRGAAPATADIEIEGGRFDKLPNRAPLLFTADRREGLYAETRLDARTDLATRYAIRLPLAPGQALFIANTLVRDPVKIASACEAAATAAGARRETFGRSLQGRELVAYHLPGERPRGTILVTSGFHQAEADTLATEAILRWLAAPDAGPVRSRFDVVVVPIVNPDGFALGTQGSNAADINMYWWFARRDALRCPEAASLWALASRLAPLGYIDFHAYTMQLDKDAGPYLKPVSYYRTPAVRKAAAIMTDALKRRPDVCPLYGFGAIAPSTLTAILTGEFDTLTLAKYHLHLKHGVDHYRVHAIAALQTMAQALEAADVAVNARVRTSALQGLVRAASDGWAGLLRPALGQLRRGQLDISLTRNALIVPK